MLFFKKIVSTNRQGAELHFLDELQLIYYVLKLINKNAEAPPNGSCFSTHTKTKLKGTQTDFYIREGAFCCIAFLHSVGCRSPPFLSASFDLMVIEQ